MKMSKRYVVSFNRSDCKEKLEQVGNIIYTPVLALDFVIMECNDIKKIWDISGITSVEDEMIGSLSV